MDSDHCYIVSTQTPQEAVAVTLDDQFPGSVELSVDEPLQFCIPTSKNGDDIEEPDWHLTMYGAAANLTPHRLITSEDQFGLHEFETVGARVLLVPTWKIVGPLQPPDELNHYWCYEIDGERVRESVTLEDQFSAGGVSEPIEDEELHLTCYEIKGPQKTNPTTFPIHNQIELNDNFTVTAWELLCAPTEKISEAPIP